MPEPSVDCELLLVNLGTPTSPTPEAVRAFLSEFLSDPMVVDRPARWIWLAILHGIVLRRRPAAVAEMYAKIWTPDGSPLAVQTEALARAVAREVAGGVRVTPAYRYGTPSLAEQVERAAGRAERVVVVPLFPQPTASSSGSIAHCVGDIAEQLGLATRLSLHELEPDDSGYVKALAARYRDAVRDSGSSEPRHLIISFHGIPERVDGAEQRIYSQACARTAEALCKAIGRDSTQATLSYQSRFGREPWLGPATWKVLEELPGRGLTDVAVTTPGFLTDGLETLEEIGVRGRAIFELAGGQRFLAVPAPSDHPALVASLARVSGCS